MDRKKKLETSLEGLFSKSKGTQQPTRIDQVVETPVPAPVVEPGKPVVQETVAAVITIDPGVEKKEAPAPGPVEPAKEFTRPEPTPLKPMEEPAAVSQTLPVPADEKVNLGLAAVSESPLAVLDENESDIQLLVFEINLVQYAINVSLVQTIIKPQAVFLVPGTADYLKGLINLRGEVVPVIDLRTRFDLPTEEVTKDTRFVVVKVSDIMASMVVDRVHGVETVPLNLIEKPSGLVMDADNVYLTGMARYKGQIVLILDLMHTIRPPATEQR